MAKRQHVSTFVGLLLLACGNDNLPADPPQEPSREVEDLGSGCLRITRTIEPVWECDATGPRSPSFGLAPPPEVERPAKRLESLGCDALAEQLRENTTAVTEALIRQTYERALLDHCSPTTEVIYELDGEPVAVCGPSLGWSAGSGGSAAGLSLAPSNPPAAEARDYSTTNNQIANVEEPDYVKNDSGHIFLLHGASLYVFDAWPVAIAREIARVPLGGTPRRLFLEGNRLTILSTPGLISAGSEPCTYGYDCRATTEPGPTNVEIWDVTTPAAPKRLDSHSLPGGFVAARRVRSEVHVVTQSSSAGVPLVLGLKNIWSAKSPQDAERAVSDLLSFAETATADLSRPELLRRSFGTVSCSAYHGERAGLSSPLTLVTSFTPSSPSELEFTAIASPAGFVAASEEALYLAVDRNVNRLGGLGGLVERTDLHKFSYSSPHVAYRGSAEVLGHVLNQFSMDERDGVLRVATSRGWVPDPEVSSLVTTLDESSGAFAPLGRIEGIAPGEDLRSVRVDGDRAFLVTFKTTDPLFAIDLSEPATPRTLGELKIPGFSTYLHPIDHDHLLGIGFETQESEGTAYFEGIQLQLFDISDLSAPALLHKTVLGTRGSSSEALTNHLAFNYFPAQKTLALPVTICEGGGLDRFADAMTFSGLIAYEVDVEAGFRERRRVSFADLAATPWTGREECSAWWAQSNSTVRRSIFFENYLYGITDGGVRAVDLDEATSPAVTLPLPLIPRTPQSWEVWD